MYIDLNRQFLRLNKDEVVDEEYEARAELDLVSAFSWSDLLAEYRVVILASAGTGKTVEIRHQCELLRAQGHPAVFLRLEHLASDWDVPSRSPVMKSWSLQSKIRKNVGFFWILLMKRA